MNRIRRLFAALGRAIEKTFDLFLTGGAARW